MKEKIKIKIKQMVNEWNLVVFILMTVMCLLLIAGIAIPSENVSLEIDGVGTYALGWKNAESGKEIVNEILPLESNQTVVIEHVISKDADSDWVLGIQNNNLHITASIQGEVIYESGADSSVIFGKELGYIWNLIQIPNQANGEILTLQLENLGNDNAFNLTTMVSGSSVELYKYIIAKNMTSVIVSALIFFFGVLLLSYYAILKLSRSSLSKTRFFYLGLLALNSALWIFLDGDSLQMFSTTASLRYQGSFFTFMLIPIFTYLFFREYTTHYKQVLELCLRLYITTIFVVLFLYRINIVHVSKSISIIHEEIVAMVIILLGVALMESVKFKEREMVAPMMAFAALAIAACVNLIDFYTAKDYDDSKALRIGILGFFLILTLTTVRYSLKEYHKQVIDNIARQELRVSKVKNDFLAKMSHDMRTPLNGIIGLTTLAEEREGNPMETQKDLRQMKESATYLLCIINDILDMSKIEHGKMELAIAPFDIQKAVVSTSDLLEQQMHEKQIAFSTSFSPNVGSIYLGDRLRFSQIIMNLLSNAVKFTPIHGKINVALDVVEQREEEDLLQLRVKDTGNGMSQEFLDRMFMPFEQENEFVAENQGGTGLGLSIVGSLVDLMKGTIKVNSTMGEGSEFIISLPLKRSSMMQIKSRETPTEDFEMLKGQRVLLVDDHPINRDIAVRLLEKKDMLVEVAENGLQALEKFEQSPEKYYKAILMDVRMPIMDGYCATEKIRNSRHQEAKTIPILAMTANAYEEDVQRCLEVGMNEHLAKPIEPAKLYRCLQKIIQGMEQG